MMDPRWSAPSALLALAFVAGCAEVVPVFPLVGDDGGVLTEVDAGFVDAGSGSVPSRVSGGFYPGTLEVFYEGSWRSVCDDSPTLTQIARVACRQQGYSGGEATGSASCAIGTFWLDEVSCSGTERDLGQCRHASWGVHNCGAGECILLRCF